MSSNAFARSRPRVRHQRVPRAHTCDHPRFIQLVNELARINEAKKKQEESDSSRSCGDAVDPGGLNHQTGGNNGGNCAEAYGTATVSRCVSGACSAINQTTSVRQVIGNCYDNIDTQASQTLNGYRPLDSHQSTSALHDNYYQHINNNNNNNNNHVHHHHQQQHYAHTQQPQLHHHYDPQQIVNNMHHPDDRCPSKSSSTNFGYSKQNTLVEQQGSDLSNDNPDLRQDENRSKRKRSSNDALVGSKKTLASCSSGTSVSKKLKSSPEGVRPLSPSFTKCPICLLDCMDRDPSFTNTCFHLFCYVCIENWTKNKATCPLCRTKFSKIIYNIKSATNYEEKVASPVRRDEDDGYVPDRLMLEHFTTLNQNPAPSNRTTNSEDVQFLFENLHRNTAEVLMPQYFLNQQMDPRQRESLHSFNTVTSSANFSSNVPHSSFSATSYPIASNGYIALFPNPTTTAITSAYPNNTGLTNMTINSDPNGRRVSRSGRSIYSRPNYEHPATEVPARMPRASIAPQNLPTIPIERAHNHHHQEQHQSHHQHHHHHHQHETRSSLDMSARQIQRAEQPSMHFQTAFAIQPRQYNPTAFTRRTYNGSHDPQHILDFYRRSLPDI